MSEIPLFCLLDQAPDDPVMLHHEIVTDADGDMRPVAARMNGMARCPDCGLWYPLIEEAEGWFTDTGEVESWSPGSAECPFCDLTMIAWWDNSVVLRHEATL